MQHLRYHTRPKVTIGENPKIGFENPAFYNGWSHLFNIERGRLLVHPSCRRRANAEQSRRGQRDAYGILIERTHQNLLL